jgi:AcrR family transcriptional regulator
LEVRQNRQRRRLNEAAAAVFARVGYADATAEAIAREAGMSKATFYEHFDNKEDCILALFDTATEMLLTAMGSARATDEERAVARDMPGHYRAAISALLEVIAAHQSMAQTLLVEIIGAGPRAMERRDALITALARFIDERNAEEAEAGAAPRLASLEDSVAVVGGVFELASRQLRLGDPADIRDLLPVVERAYAGALAVAAQQRPTPA